MTLPEVLVRRILRGHPAGVKFRRQHPVGPFVLDFYCPQAKLAIEVDGLAHDLGTRPTRDARRDAVLAAAGIGTVRVAAADILADAEKVADAVVALCAPPLHQPSAGPPPHAAHRED